jgi:hypothetical protein
MRVSILRNAKLWDLERHSTWLLGQFPIVGDTGIEPVTSSVSRKRASPCANRPRGGDGI